MGIQLCIELVISICKVLGLSSIVTNKAAAAAAHAVIPVLRMLKQEKQPYLQKRRKHTLATPCVVECVFNPSTWGAVAD